MNEKRAGIARHIVRWTTGGVVALGIIIGSAIYFPNTPTAFPALVLTCSLAAIVGLKIGLPPLQQADDWVRIGLVEKHETQRKRQTVSIPKLGAPEPNLDKILQAGHRPGQVKAFKHWDGHHWHFHFHLPETLKHGFHLPEGLKHAFHLHNHPRSKVKDPTPQEGIPHQRRHQYDLKHQHQEHK